MFKALISKILSAFYSYVKINKVRRAHKKFKALFNSYKCKQFCRKERNENNRKLH